jgi:RNA polymerase sigma factor (sigma-70 family)
MTSKSTFEHRLHDLIEEGPTTAPAQLLETVVSTVPSIPQRRGAWRAPWRTSFMVGFARALAGVAIAVAVGSAVLFLLVLRPAGDVGRRWGSGVRLIPSDRSSQTDTAADVADRDELERGFRRLSPEQRAVLVLHHYLGYQLTEIASTLGIPVGTARSRLHYATRQLRAAIEADARPTRPKERTA